MKKKKKGETNMNKTSMTLSQIVKNKIKLIQIKYGFKTQNDVILALTKIEAQFHPELKKFAEKWQKKK